MLHQYGLNRGVLNMYVFVNERNEIKSVDTPIKGLTGYYISDETSPFKGMSNAAICCYSIEVNNGIVMSMTPYVDYSLIEHINQLGVEADNTESVLMDTQMALVELYEIIMGGTNNG